jgi:CelD/BcsL family acetyltransferase involved in cellulose biosynthesis
VNSKRKHNGAGVSLSIDVLDRQRAAAELDGDLADLACRSLESNPFYEPMMLLPALRLIDAEQPLSVICVRRGAQLIGLFVMQRTQVRNGVPIAVLRSWSHRYCFLSSPLLDQEHGGAALEAVADWVESGKSPASVLDFPEIHRDGPFARMASEVLLTRRGWIADVVTSQRALLSRARLGEATISGRHAKELRRLERRLADLGWMSYDELAPGNDVGPWMQEFIRLEASGWKGREGTAIGQSAADRAFFASFAEAAHDEGALQFLALRLNGAAIAMKVNVLAREQSFALKIAHDEQYAKYSPGVLLERFNEKRFAEAPPGCECMDSCALEGHSMIERLWPDRRQIASLTLAGRGLAARAFIALRARLRARALSLRQVGASVTAVLAADLSAPLLRFVETMPISL